MSDRKETRGRKKKDLKSEIMCYIDGKPEFTISELSNNFKVCNATIRSNIKELQKDGILLIPNKKGYKYFESIDDIDSSEKIINASIWSKGFFDYFMHMSQLTGSSLTTAIKIMSEKIDDKTIKKLKQTMSIYAMTYQLIETERMFDNQEDIKPEIESKKIKDDRKFLWEFENDEINKRNI